MSDEYPDIPTYEIRTDPDTGKLLCRGQKKNGDPCGMPPSLVDQSTGWCDAHNPEKAGEMAERASKGGRRTGGNGISPNLTPAEVRDELGKLEDHDDAMRWMFVLARKAAGGLIDPKLASQVRMAVKEWRKNYEHGQIEAAEEAAEKAMDAASGAFGPKLVKEE